MSLTVIGPRPVARAEVLRAYWHVACERQRIFHARVAGAPGPWTDDPIFARYKFCNAYRASDRVSQDLIANVIYADGTFTDADVLLRTVLYRLFSRPETWRALEAELGPVTTRSFSFAAIDRILQRRMDAGERNYTAAFILCANKAYGHDRKHRNHLALIEDMFASGTFCDQVAACGNLEQLNAALASWPLLGTFMAYQIATDIAYGPVGGFEEAAFTVAGPGAQRGIRKVFSDRAGWSDADIILMMCDEQERQIADLGLRFEDLWGRRLQPIDCQNLFCETDKYSRVAFPQLTSNRSKIKQTFTPAGPLPTPFYPPKWQINERAAGSAQAT